MLGAFILALAIQAGTTVADPSSVEEPQPQAAPEPAEKPVYGPPAPRKTKKTAATQAKDGCAGTDGKPADPATILVCGQSPSDEYRLDRSVMQAEQDARHPPQRPNPPLGQPPREPTLCERSGGCRATEAFDFIQAAMVAGRMAVKAMNGENPLDVFVTNRRPDEYQIYQESKAAREVSAEEAAAEQARVRILARANTRNGEEAGQPAAPPPFPEARTLVPWVYDTKVDDCVWTMAAPDEKWVRGGIGRGDEDPVIDFVDAAFFDWSDAEDHLIEVSAGDPNYRLPAKGWASNAGGQTPGSIAFYLDAPLRKMVGGATSLQVWKAGKPVFNTRLADTPSTAQLNACVRQPSHPAHTDEE